MGLLGVSRFHRKSLPNDCRLASASDPEGACRRVNTVMVMAAPQKVQQVSVLWVLRGTEREEQWNSTALQELIARAVLVREPGCGSDTRERGNFAWSLDPVVLGWIGGRTLARPSKPARRLSVETATC